MSEQREEIRDGVNGWILIEYCHDWGPGWDRLVYQHRDTREIVVRTVELV